MEQVNNPQHADVDNVPGVPFKPVARATANRGPSPVIWALLAVSTLLALAVIFVLPGVVERYELPFTPRVESTTPAAPEGVASAPAGNPISPFEEAQKARQRAEAQDVLASLLDRQSELELLSVSAWAADDYQAALALARLGDEAYRTQEFGQAAEQYRLSDAALAALVDSVPTVFGNALAAGNAALEEGDAALANASFTRALTLRPQDADAQAGLARATTLEQVTQLLDESAALIARGDLSAAETQLQQAVNLDPLHAGAREQLAQVRSQLADNSFTSVMSEGFAAMQTGDSDAAIAAFERALAMRPGSQQALEAITQTRDQLAVDQITTHQDSARSFEASEQWASAVAEYDAALAIDSNLVFAQQGRDYAQKRLQLDTLLQSAIQQPARLADAAVHEQAVQVYYTGRGLENPGPRLQQQLAEVETLLDKAQVPAQVQLVSDNLTEVTLYQVGVLGRFETHELMLKPGNYVAVGTRPGYRDVRAEFEVGFDGRSTPVTIACTEEVVAVNRR
jgi:tetratricopeptide (TPR) repeat protein